MLLIALRYKYQVQYNTCSKSTCTSTRTVQKLHTDSYLQKPFVRPFNEEVFAIVNDDAHYEDNKLIRRCKATMEKRLSKTTQFVGKDIAFEPKSSNAILKLLPPEVISNLILAQFCSGKTMSTFALVLEGCSYNNLKKPGRTTKQQLDELTRRQNSSGNSSTRIMVNSEDSYSTSAIICDALICRFEILLRQIDLFLRNGDSTAPNNNYGFQSRSTNEPTDTAEIQDVLEYFKAETCILLKEQQTHNDSYNVRLDNFELVQSRIKYISNCCAIIDYFEQIDYNTKGGESIIWVGLLDTSHGIINNAILTCSNIRSWTAASILYWYNDFELYEYKLVTPYTSPNLRNRIAYGTLRCVVNNNTTDIALLRQICHSLNYEHDPLGRFSLVPRHLGFESAPSLFFTKESKSSLKCYWNPDDVVHYDWEDALEELGTNLIRIMTRLQLSEPDRNLCVSQLNNADNLNDKSNKQDSDDEEDCDNEKDEKA